MKKIEKQLTLDKLETQCLFLPHKQQTINWKVFG